jgi:DNA repair protein RecN (Recombination protein N)
MLTLLDIENFVLIESMRLELDPGLNVLTGETGAGKSIVLEAIELLLGAKASGNLVRTGSTRACVQGEFEFASGAPAELAQLLATSGCDGEIDAIIIRREIGQGGRSRVFVNNCLATTTTLKSLQPYLGSLQSQGIQYSLFNEATQLEILDDFAEVSGNRETVANLYGRMTALQAQIDELDRGAEELKRQYEFLRYQLAEIDRVSPQAGEEQQLISERNIVKHAEKVRELSTCAYSELYENDESALSKISLSEKALSSLSIFDDRAGVWVESLITARSILEDLANTVRDYIARSDESPERLDELESRLAELDRLKRKHGTDIDGVLKVKTEIEGKLVATENFELERSELVAALRDAMEKYFGAAQELSKRRLAARKTFQKAVLSGLKSVALEKSSFELSINTLDLDGLPERAPAGFGKTGIDQVTFLFSANPGEPIRPIVEVASGGELSRLFLVLQTLEGKRRHQSEVSATIIFDEIDTGIGGRVAEAIGRRLKELSASRQVICVTHQPQIARFANKHFVVAKTVTAGRTVTTVDHAAGERRIAELVRMVGGKDDLEARRIVDRIFELGEAAAVKPEKQGYKSRV